MTLHNQVPICFNIMRLGKAVLEIESVTVLPVAIRHHFFFSNQPVFKSVNSKAQQNSWKCCIIMLHKFMMFLSSFRGSGLVMEKFGSVCHDSYFNCLN